MRVFPNPSLRGTAPSLLLLLLLLLLHPISAQDSIASKSPEAPNFISQRSSLDGISLIRNTSDGAVFISPTSNTTGLIELRIGLLLPYSTNQDAYMTAIVQSCTSAVRMAVNEINSQQIIKGAYVTLVEKDSFPIVPGKNVSGSATSIFSAVELLQHGVVGIIGDITSSITKETALVSSRVGVPQCSFAAWAPELSNKKDYGYFFRTIPSMYMYADVLLHFMVSQGWRRFAILYNSDGDTTRMFDHVSSHARELNLELIMMQPFDDAVIDPLNISLNHLKNSGARVIIVVAKPSVQIFVLRRARALGLLNPEFVWLCMGAAFDFSSPDPNNLYDGVFAVYNKYILPGYPPFEEFIGKWNALDSKEYLYAGRNQIIANEGLAYSCMMMMALGFNKAVQNSPNPDRTLRQITSLRLSDALTPPAFNTGYVGPGGPMVLNNEGDLTNGNFILFNMQNGSLVNIAEFGFGKLKLTGSPVYTGGSSIPPSDTPSTVAINPTYGSVGGISVLIVTGAGMAFVLATMAIVIIYREIDVFKASSPLFCCLELVGFMFAYIGVVLWLNVPTATMCALRPLFLCLGFALVLGNIVAKNFSLDPLLTTVLYFRVYRIFDNVFVSRTVIHDSQLIKVTSVFLGIEALLLVLYLFISPPLPELINVGEGIFYWDCKSYGPASFTLFLLLFIYNAGLIFSATFLAFKTRRVLGNWNECRQISFCVYNILLVVCIAVPAALLPTEEPYTKHYVQNIAVLWGTTISALILFLPKLWKFFRGGAENTPPANIIITAGSSPEELYSGDLDPVGGSGVLSGENGAANADGILWRRKQSFGASISTVGVCTCETLEGRLPIKVQYRYFPFLGRWEMARVAVFPDGQYFSYIPIDETVSTGSIFRYRSCSIVSNGPHSYIFRVHGTGWKEFLFQVKDAETLAQWMRWFDKGENLSGFSSGQSLVHESLTGLAVEYANYNADQEGSSGSIPGTVAVTISGSGSESGGDEKGNTQAEKRETPNLPLARHGPPRRVVLRRASSGLERRSPRPANTMLRRASVQTETGPRNHSPQQ
ncbi:uncharacterized protein VTP21DRAFT_5556 [Calcarisporiella thermophila]|uniref:uncharacterized protein n=1 Tax=Calcarisporiella thermophila TaxID=911321 RepID=UPI0037431400